MAKALDAAVRAYRIGCGRYIQENGACSLAGREVKLLGLKKVLLIGGTTALSLASGKITASLKEADIPFNVTEYKGYCNTDEAKRIASENGDCDCVIGAGGGHIMDMAKLIANFIGDVAVINVPTISATCAAYSPFSVLYTKDYAMAGKTHHQREIACILADMDILGTQPSRYLISGALDAMAKYIEISARLGEDAVYTADQGLLSSYVLSKYSYETLNRILPEAVADIERGECSKAVYDTVFISIALTGTISGLALGMNQSAVAHNVYYNCRTLYPRENKDMLHGEIVAIGLIPQLCVNNRYDMIPEMQATLKKYGIPLKMTDYGVPYDGLEKYYEACAASTAMEGAGEEEKKRLYEGFKMIF